ncbi:MAG: type II secretion protein N [Magnetococcales bacterium]|nr:type II secretion protein N [Magnetococcales bacterium]HIJ84058.1 type II secretion system protein GspN [Magnetococcales bacterium]
MMGIKGYLSLGVMGYLFFLVSSLPASLAWSWIGVDSGVLTLEEISGTLWSGRATRVVAAHFNMGPFKWKIRWDKVFKLSPQVDFVLEGKDGFHLHGAVALAAGPTLHIKDWVFSSPLSSLSPLMVRVPVDLTGQLDAHVDHLAVDREGKVVEISAGGKLMDFAVGVPWDKPLGGYGLEAVLGVDGEVLIHIKDVEGAIRTALVLKIYHDGRYRLRGSLSAGKKLDDQSAEFLKQWIGFDRAKLFPVNTEGRLGDLL